MPIIKRFATEDYVADTLAQTVPTDAVLYSPQTLTEEQKAQARANLGISNNGGTGTIPPVEEPVTTEYVYTYDGDKDTDANTWVTNYGNIRVFVKMGEVPKGELNLVGSTLFRTNPNNQWLDRTFTITEEHLSKALTKSGETIPAV